MFRIWCGKSRNSRSAEHECAWRLATTKVNPAHVVGGRRWRVGGCCPPQLCLLESVMLLTHHAQSFTFMCDLALVRRSAARACYGGSRRCGHLVLFYVARVLRRHGFDARVCSRTSEVVLPYHKLGFDKGHCIGERVREPTEKRVSVISGDLTQSHEWSAWSPPWMYS